jgi:hypothetical protein
MTIAPERQAISIHTQKGVQLYQYLPARTMGIEWGRILRDVSRATVTLPPDDHLAELDIVPWLHWVSIWDVNDSRMPLWTGPLMRPRINRNSLTLEVWDCAAFMMKTRVPFTKAWEATDPAYIAAELWEAMTDNHGLNVTPIVRPDPEGQPFDFQVKADTNTMDTVIRQLVDLGLRWTVVKGVPILGPASKKHIQDLGAQDFLGDGLELSRDGSQSANDILLRNSDAIARARVPMAGLNLQSIVTIDKQEGASNAERAVYEQAKYFSQIHDSVTVPQGSELHPEAPVVLDDLIPSTRFTVTAYGLRTLVELEDMKVAATSGAVTTTVSMESVVELPELSTVTGSGQAGAS